MNVYDILKSRELIKQIAFEDEFKKEMAFKTCINQQIYFNFWWDSFVMKWLQFRYKIYEYI